MSWEVPDIFGVDRCMFGTDRPVCLVAASSGQVIDALRECLSDLTGPELEQVFGRSTARACRLPL